MFINFDGGLIDDGVFGILLFAKYFDITMVLKALGAAVLTRTKNISWITNNDIPKMAGDEYSRIDGCLSRRKMVGPAPTNHRESCVGRK